MLWKMWYFTVQSMGRTNHKFPIIIPNMECSNALQINCKRGRTSNSDPVGNTVWKVNSFGACLDILVSKHVSAYRNLENVKC